jgi:hypothetical protein
VNFDLKIKPVMKGIKKENDTSSNEYRLFILFGDKPTLANIIIPLELAREAAKLNNAQ